MRKFLFILNTVLAIKVATEYISRYMNSFKNHISLIFVCTIAVTGCLESYQPPEIVSDVNILVVDGFLNSTEGSATVRILHATALSDDSKPKPEANATVSIHAEGGTSYVLTEQDSGTYSISGLNIDPATRYQLSIRTSDEEEYVSDYVEIKESPDIDSVSWEAKEDGINILVNTHDASGNTKYYRWDYIETWEYNAPISSEFKLVDGEPVYRSLAERIYTCWRTVPSTKISIASTVRLTEDVVYNYPIVFLPKGTSKVTVKYSILVKQRAVTKDEFTFLEQLQKSTESLGGLFDPQPSQVAGNIHNLSDPSAPALGYFSAGTVKEKRFFLSFGDLPNHLNKYPFPGNCLPDTICLVRGMFQPYRCILVLEDLTGSELIGHALYSRVAINGYTLSSPQCADCRTQGGVLAKPDFWP